jgi:hypothetical protein
VCAATVRCASRDQKVIQSYVTVVSCELIVFWYTLSYISAYQSPDHFSVMVVSENVTITDATSCKITVYLYHLRLTPHYIPELSLSVNVQPNQLILLPAVIPLQSKKKGS